MLFSSTVRHLGTGGHYSTWIGSTSCKDWGIFGGLAPTATGFMGYIGQSDFNRATHRTVEYRLVEAVKQKYPKMQWAGIFTDYPPGTMQGRLGLLKLMGWLSVNPQASGGVGKKNLFLKWGNRAGYVK